jgi:hypothetical protein
MSACNVVLYPGTATNIAVIGDICHTRRGARSAFIVSYCERYGLGTKGCVRMRGFGVVAQRAIAKIP